MLVFFSFFFFFFGGGGRLGVSNLELVHEYSYLIVAADSNMSSLRQSLKESK